MTTPAAVRPARLAADLRSLGWGAPIRAVYELSKRAGAHRALLGRMAATDTLRPVPPLRACFPPPAEVPGAARERTLVEAADIAAGRLTLFGRQLDLGDPPDWHAVLDGPGSWPRSHWWTIDIRSPARRGDVKWTWELNRHRHLVVLARAAYLEPHEPRWLAVLERHLGSWVVDNPLEVGVQWASNLEIALRAVAWAQVLSLTGERLARPLRDAMGRVLWHAGKHLVFELPYTLSTMANNHLLGDALGLLVIGRSFDHPTAARWAAAGARLFDRQAGREVRADGSTIDEALSYHRFVLEMLLVRAMLDRDLAALERAARAARYLARLGVLDGPVPQYGDWDEGRLLVSSAPDATTDLSGTALAALALAGGGAPPDQRERYDELAWYIREGEPIAPEPAVTGGVVGGGIARATTGPVRVWLRTGERRWHGHADLCSTEIAVGDRWLVGDPGTGAYNADPGLRDGLRCSAAHAVLRVRGLDQLEPHRVFRWRHHATGVLGEPATLDGLTVLWGVHDAYARVDPPVVVVRAVLVDTDPPCIAVADWVLGGGPACWQLDLPLGPEVATEIDGCLVRCRPGDEDQWSLHLPAPAEAVRGRREPWMGWWSRTYGELEPATWLAVRGRSAGPVLWQAVPGAGPAPDLWHADDGRLVRRCARAEPMSRYLVWVEQTGREIRLQVGRGESEWTSAVVLGGG
ncbi:heparinase II/III domain-containing protein [Rhabdothermincola sp.]|uniref:heparinase II/III domain-containing protein n=1 Tax=Rhabdothermincola sp. TaxID=2820405 RepID=UPI002FDF0B28